MANIIAGWKQVTTGKLIVGQPETLKVCTNRDARVLIDAQHLDCRSIC